jgi:uncharacterized OB-fold protein
MTAPIPTPETAPFWEAARQGHLRLPRCNSCRELIFYPRPFCPRCHHDEVTWEELSGRATLHTYVICHHRAGRGRGADAPYVLAIVELEEGPRMMTNVVGVEPVPESLILDMPLQVEFAERGDERVPVFRPVS